MLNCNTTIRSVLLTTSSYVIWNSNQGH